MIKNEKYQKLQEFAKSLDVVDEFNKMIKSIEIIDSTLYENVEVTALDNNVIAILEEKMLEIKKSEIEKEIANYEEQLKNPDLKEDEITDIKKKLNNLKIDVKHISTDILVARNTQGSTHKTIQNDIYDFIKKTSIKEELQTEFGNYQKYLDKISLTADKKVKDNQKSEVAAVDKPTEINPINNEIAEILETPLVEVEKDNKEEIDYKKAYEDMKKKYEEEHQKNIELQEQLSSLKEQLASLKTDIEQMKNNTISNKLKNGFKKAKRKVIAVKDYMKAHPKQVALGVCALIALGGLTATTIVYGSPVVGVARVVSALWKPLHHIGLGNALHGINEGLLGHFMGASFDQVSGIWSLGGKALNDLGVLEIVLDNIGVAGALAAGGVAAYKGGKKAWLAVAKSKFADKLKGKIKNIKDKVFNREEPNSLVPTSINRDDLFTYAYNACKGYSLDELQEKIDILVEALDSNSYPSNIAKEEIEEVLKALKKVYVEKSETKENVQSDILDEIETLSEEEINAILANLEEVIEKHERNEIPDVFEESLDGSYGTKNIDELMDLYNKLEAKKESKFGGIRI